MTIADDPQALAGFVRHLGGEIVEAPTFRFEIPLAETRRVVPEINKLGLRCERISERTGTDPNNGNAARSPLSSSTPAGKERVRRRARAYGCAHSVTRRCSGLPGHAVD